MLEFVVGPRAADSIEIAVKRANIGRDRHLVVVEQNYHPLLEMPDLIDALERHPRRQTGVADERNDIEVFALEVSRRCDSQRRRNGSAGVSRVEHVIFGFFATQETAQTVVLTNCGKLIAAAGQNLVRVGLVAYVEYQPVARRVQRIVQRGYQLDRA